MDEPSVQPVRSGPSAARLRVIRAASAHDARGRSSHNPPVVGSSPTKPPKQSSVSPPRTRPGRPELSTPLVSNEPLQNSSTRTRRSLLRARYRAVSHAVLALQAMTAHARQRHFRLDRMRLPESRPLVLHRPDYRTLEDALCSTAPCPVTPLILISVAMPLSAHGTLITQL